ncbi:MAG: hypothetical protein LAP85_06800 [Acidobacteriia bacterium]|nr:hypothetical protein [Terriglobia bacterium]
MVSRKQKAICLATGGTAAAALVWLRYAKSAAGARSFLGEAGAKVSKTLGDLQSALSTLRKRTEEVDRLVHELVRLGSEQKAKAEVVINDALKRLGQTTDVIQQNLTQSSNEISALLKDIRSAAQRSVLSRPSRAA